MYKQVSLLGGTFQRCYNEDTTLVIAASSASPKVYAASQADLPIVTRTWLQSCFERRVRIPLKDFLIKPFFGCKFCSSDLTPRQRSELSRLVRAGGGLWCDLFDESATFLVAHTLSNSTKVSLALSGNVPIVRPDWVRQSSSKIRPPSDFTLNWWCFGSPPSMLFADCTFEIAKGVENDRVLVDAIIANGGQASPPSGFVVAPHGSQPAGFGRTLVSAQWVWSCVSEKRVLSVDSSLGFSPFPFAPPIEGVSGCAFVLLNFDDRKRIELANVLRSLRARVYFSFSTEAKLIVVEQVDPKVADLAHDYSIPVVRSGWITELVKTGKFPQAAEYAAVATGFDLRALCRTLMRSSSRPSDPCEMGSIDFRKLECFSQVAPECDTPKIKVMYGSPVQAVAIPFPAGEDPLLTALATC
jgi:hypothetical protein